MLNPQKIAELRNDPHMKELFDIIEDMKNPPKNIKDDADVQAVMEMASMLETDVKNIIMVASLEPVGRLDAMQLVEKATRSIGTSWTTPMRRNPTTRRKRSRH